MKKFLAIIAFVFLVVTVCAQQQSSNSIFSTLQKTEANQGVVEINQPVVMEQLMQSYIASNKRKQGVEGYRIQIYSETGARARQEAEGARNKLLTEFPNENVTISYDAPYWRVRVGYFRHKHETLLTLQKLRQMFPNGYAVRDSGIKPEFFGL